jgi:hydroxymethylpyrimidine/phosphomethylpyrimidine kinase
MVSPATLPEHQYTIVAAGLAPDLLTMAQTDWAAAQAATAVVAEKTKMVGLAS